MKIRYVKLPLHIACYILFYGIVVAVYQILVCYFTTHEHLLQGCSNDLIIFRADGGNHFTHYGIYEGMFLIFDVSKDFKDGHLSCYLNNSGDDRPKFKVSDKPLDGYRHLGRLVASMKNYEV